MSVRSTERPAISGWSSGGRVDVKACVAALKEVGFSGWAIIELDRVPDAGGSPKASAILNKEYAERQLGLAV